MSNVDFLPKLEDLLAAGTAAAASSAFSGLGSPQQAFMEQGVAQVVAKVAANYFDVTNVGENVVGVSEHCVWTGLLRGGYSLQQSRKNNRVMMDSLKGLLCCEMGKQLAKYLRGNGSANNNV